VICLINPPQQQLREPLAYVPLGLAYVATNVEAIVINMAAGFLPDVIPEYGWYGITCQAATLSSVSKVVRYLKSHYPYSKVIIGGSQPSIAPKETLAQTGADIAIMGEAENVLPELLNGRLKPIPIIDAGIISNLNELASPHRDLFSNDVIINLTGIHGSFNPSTTMVSSRGCPFNCAFCCKGHKMFRGHRIRSAASIVEEMEQLNQRYGIKHIRFVDDCFTLHKKRTLELCEALKDIDMTFMIITRVDTVDREILTALNKVGCIQIDYGIESGSQRVLNLMNKRVTVEQNKNAIHLAKECGLKVKTFLMMGFPGETKDDRQATLDFLKETKPDDFTLSYYSPYIDGEYFYPDDCKEWREFREQIQEMIGDNRLSYIR